MFQGESLFWFFLSKAGENQEGHANPIVCRDRDNQIPNQKPDPEGFDFFVLRVSEPTLVDSLLPPGILGFRDPTSPV